MPPLIPAFCNPTVDWAQSENARIPMGYIDAFVGRTVAEFQLKLSRRDDGYDD
jgi:hypothetical protein